ncbi:MAG: tetratricopeptide repeat protein [Planctomycetota bacterium]|nr:tetratricopeptide repeat protein [Planctomycetota bacterium]
MPDDPRVQRLIEEILDSDTSAEEVCRDTPELLPQVREGWRRLRAIEDRIGELFPEPGSVEDFGATPPDTGLPRVPGYDLIEVLGRGGVGVVYKAVHLGLNRTVALKMLLAGAFATWAERQRFSRESEVVAGLRHPNIVQIYDVGDLDGRPYFTMEFVEGGSLAEMLEGTPRPARQAAELLAILADAVEAAHRGGIVHRDLKPSNVLLTADGTPKIADFGLARHLEAGSSLTRSGAALGTPSYMAPEQARGRSSETEPASDLYSLGAVLYELLTGRPPFRAESAAETVYQVLTQDPVPPSRLNAKVPRDLETICLKCLRKDPRLRYAGAAALAEDLLRFLKGESIAARPENGLQRLGRRVRRRPAFSAAVAAVTLVTMTLVGGGLWLMFERATMTRMAQAERAERDRAAGDDLREMARWLRKSAWPEAAAAMERAKGRLGECGGSPEVRSRLDRGIRDLKLVARLDANSLDSTSSVGGHLALDRSVEAHQRAFDEAGLGRVGDEPGAVAARVIASDIRSGLVAMLDDCAFHAKDPSQQDWLRAVARLADEDPTGWRNQARDPAIWSDEARFLKLVETAPVDDQSVPFLLALANHLRGTDEAFMPFLKRIQQSHPGDFWANILLGERLRMRGNPGESIRYYQAALALRPGAGVVHNELGSALQRLSRFEEAVDHHRRAVRIDPTAAQGHHNLATALQGLGRYDEAIEHSNVAIRLRPEVAVLYLILGIGLEARGQDVEGIGAYRRAIVLDPRSAARGHLRNALLRTGSVDEARVIWAEILATTPSGHDARYGYAELCLFLGFEAEYRRARKVLLADFGSATDPLVAERTARACLLLPASEDEMRRIVALGERAWGVDRSKYPGVYPHFEFVRGLAEYRQGRLDRAISLMRGDASGVLGPAPRLVLAMALRGRGEAAEARKTLAEAILAHDWRAGRARDQDGWIYHSLRREAEALILADLPAFLEGTHRPRDNHERLAMLGACQFADRPGSAAGLYADAFADDPRLPDDLRSGHRYNAARVAARAGCGLGTDAMKLGDPERGQWRAQARTWLRADLAAWNKALDDPMAAPDPVRVALARWRGDPDLAGLRESAELGKLSAGERKDCLALWEEVGVIYERAGHSR